MPLRGRDAANSAAPLAQDVMCETRMMNKAISLSLATIVLASCASGPANTDGEMGYKGQGQAVGYESPAVVLERLRNDPKAQLYVKEGWTVVEIESERTIWTFPPASHPAYPSAVKREVVQKDGSIYIDTTVNCNSRKSVCDQLVRDFNKLNEKVFQHIQSQ